MATTACSRKFARGVRVVAPVLAAVSIVLAAGCGSGTESPDVTGPSASATASASSGHAHADSTFCSSADQFNGAQSEIKHKVSGGSALGAARDAISAGARMRQFAPASLAASVRLVTNTFQPFFTALVADHGVVSKALGVEMSIAASLHSSRFQAAAGALGSYEARHCGSSHSNGH